MGILQMSMSAGLLVIAIVLIRVVALNKLPKTMFLVLWGVALCRLLLPVSVPLRYSVYSAMGEIAKIAPANTVIQSVVESALPMGNPAASAAGTAGMAEQMPQAAREQFLDMAPATIVWLVGMLATFAVFAAVYFKNHRELRFALIIRDNDFLNRWLAEHRLLRPIAILRSDRTATPVAASLVAPRIILPTSMDMENEQLLNYVLAHEYCHIKRCDTLWKLLCALALCVHWFNPLVWVMFVLVNRDLEITCDEMVLRHFGAESKTAYAYSLVGMAEQRSKFAPLYNSFSRNATEERIVSIMKIKKTSLVGILLAVVLVAGTTTAFATSAAEAEVDTATAWTRSGDEISEAPYHAPAGMSTWEYLYSLGFLEYDDTTYFQPLYRFDGRWVEAIYDPNIWQGYDYSNFAQHNDVNERFGEAVSVKVVRDAQTNEIAGLVEMTDEEMNAARTGGGNTTEQLTEIPIETTGAGNPVPPVAWEDGSGFQADAGTSTASDDAFVFDEATMPLPIYNIPELQKIVGNLNPGKIFTSNATFAIAAGQLVTFSGSWSSDFQSFEVGLYDTVSGEYTWFSCGGGVLEAYTITADHDCVSYQLAFRNPPTNIYDTTFSITSYAVVA